MGVFLCLLYWTKGVRLDAYDHPIIYELLDNGKKRLMGSRVSRKLTMFSMFGIGQEKDANGKTLTTFGLLRMMGGMGCFFAGFLIFLLVGSIAAILD